MTKSTCGMPKLDYIILIVTYNRVDTCLKKTLTMLRENRIPKDIINLVVHDEEQKRLYEEGIPTEYYNQILVTNKHEKIYGQYNWIFKKYKVGQRIIRLDDDISCIYELEQGKLVKSYRLKDIIDYGFQLCEQYGYKLWGLYPVANAFYMPKEPYGMGMSMKKKFTTDLRFIVGAFQGIINEKIELDVDITIKGDYEYTILSYLRNGGVIRFSCISMKYDIATNEGKRTEQMIKDANTLMEKYPNLVKPNNRRKQQGEILLHSSVWTNK